ncbi:MAG: hypothetical protein GY862_36450 [Gammaproteobacteria bacterium]|nr:hypothetical protein [Gammaproteobacteria bacterium]
MKITFDIDATPQELRTFFGLPDIESLQKEILDKIREKMLAGVEGYDAFSLMKPWLPENLQSMDAMQKSFWQAFLTPGKLSSGKLEPDQDKS